MNFRKLIDLIDNESTPVVKKHTNKSLNEGANYSSSIVEFKGSIANALFEDDLTLDDYVELIRSRVKDDSRADNDWLQASDGSNKSKAIYVNKYIKYLNPNEKTAYNKLAATINKAPTALANLFGSAPATPATATPATATPAAAPATGAAPTGAAPTGAATTAATTTKAAKALPKKSKVDQNILKFQKWFNEKKPSDVPKIKEDGIPGYETDKAWETNVNIYKKKMNSENKQDEYNTLKARLERSRTWRRAHNIRAVDPDEKAPDVAASTPAKLGTPAPVTASPLLTAKAATQVISQGQ